MILFREGLFYFFLGGGCMFVLGVFLGGEHTGERNYHIISAVKLR